jgi:hypothetical protein
MHFEILVEGQTEVTTLSSGILNQILGAYGEPHTWKIHKHRGIGKLPANLVTEPKPNDQTLLHNLPDRLRAYGKSLRSDQVVVVLVDLDNRPDCKAFKRDLLEILNVCQPKPNVTFRIAIEELEAWFLGDQEAIQSAYPNAKLDILKNYQQDSICGTWELLAKAIHPGGLGALQNKGKRSPLTLEEKRKWAAKITPKMDVNKNLSPSFCCFRDKLRELAGIF